MLCPAQMLGAAVGIGAGFDFAFVAAAFIRRAPCSCIRSCLRFGRFRRRGTACCARRRWLAPPQESSRGSWKACVTAKFSVDVRLLIAEEPGILGRRSFSSDIKDAQRACLLALSPANVLRCLIRASLWSCSRSRRGVSATWQQLKRLMSFSFH